MYTIDSNAHVILNTALKYAEKGYPVFPCRPSNKRPYTRHGFKDATTDVQQIISWWKRWPNAMIGLATGKVSGIWALDLDMPKTPGEDSGEAYLEKLEEAYGKLPPTWTQETPSGGKHHFFKMPGDGRSVPNSTSKIGENIDVRGDGGYVIVAPSINARGGQYSFTGKNKNIADAPEWLLRLARQPKPESIEKRAQTKTVSQPSPVLAIPFNQMSDDALKEVNTALESVKLAKQGTRNDNLNKAAFALGQLVDSGNLNEEEAKKMLIEAANICGVLQDDGEKQTLRTIEGGLKAGKQNPKTVFPNSGRNLSEGLLATAFVNQYKDKFKYCKSLGKWFEWEDDKCLWVEDRKDRVLHYIHELIKVVNTDNKPSFDKSSVAKGVRELVAANPQIATVPED